MITAAKSRVWNFTGHDIADVSFAGDIVRADTISDFPAQQFLDVRLVRTEQAQGQRITVTWTSETGSRRSAEVDGGRG